MRGAHIARRAHISTWTLSKHDNSYVAGRQNVQVLRSLSTHQPSQQPGLHSLFSVGSKKWDLKEDLATDP